MKYYLVSYDLNNKPEPVYRRLENQFLAAGAVRLLWSQWLMASYGSIDAVNARVTPFFSSDDRVLVSEIGEQRGQNLLG